MSKKALLEWMDLTSANSQRLQQQAREFTFNKSGPLIHKGQKVSGAYMVLEGELRVYTYSPEGSEATLYRLHPGDTCVLTLNCLFNDLLYPAWVEATGPSRVVLIPGDLYRHFFAEEASVRDATVKALSSLVFRLMDELEEVHTCNLEQRLTRYLLNNASEQGVVSATQQQLANHLGTSREVIARLMQGLNARKLVATGRGKVSLLNTAALTALITPADAAWPE